MASFLATIIWYSSLCDKWRVENPLTNILNWLSAETKVRRIFLLGLGVWSLASSVYIWLELRRITIHGASYFTKREQKDVTDIVRKRVAEGIRRFPVTNTFLGRDPDEGEPKEFTVDYSVWGRRRIKPAHENDIVKLR